MKRTKYNNGGLHTSYSKGVFGLEGNASGNQKQRTVSATASVQGKGFKASASKGINNLAGQSNNYSFEKQLPNRSSVSVQKNKYNTSASYNKQTKGGTNLNFGLTKNAQGTLGASMSFSKPL